MPLAQGGEMSLRLVAERADGFAEPITVKMLWNPPGVTSPRPWAGTVIQRCRHGWP